jgi:hypothetical protein
MMTPELQFQSPSGSPLILSSRNNFNDSDSRRGSCLSRESVSSRVSVDSVAYAPPGLPERRKSLAGSPHLLADTLGPSSRKASLVIPRKSTAGSPLLRTMSKMQMSSQPGSRRGSSVPGAISTDIVCRICEESVPSCDMEEHSGFCAVRKELAIKLNAVDSQLEKIESWLNSQSRKITDSEKPLRKIVHELAEMAKKCRDLPIYGGPKTVLKCIKYMGLVEKIRTHLLLRYTDEKEVSIRTNRLHEAVCFPLLIISDKI